MQSFLNVYGVNRWMLNISLWYLLYANNNNKNPDSNSNSKSSETAKYSMSKLNDCALLYSVRESIIKRDGRWAERVPASDTFEAGASKTS